MHNLFHKVWPKLKCHDGSKIKACLLHLKTKSWTHNMVEVSEPFSKGDRVTHHGLAIYIKKVS
jgi:hypothetical protein